MATIETPPEPIRGLDWHKEVGGVGYKKAEVRQKFYLELTKLKLRVQKQQQLDAVIQDPHAHDFLTNEEIMEAEGRIHGRRDDVPIIEVKIGDDDSIERILIKYFENIYRARGVDPKEKDNRKQIMKEMVLSRYYLGTQYEEGKTRRGRDIHFNVDLLRKGETVLIKDGKLSIIKRDGTKRVDDVFIREPGVLATP